MRVLLFLRELATGGTERQMLQLAATLAEEHEVTLATVFGGGAWDDAVAPRVHRAPLFDERGGRVARALRTASAPRRLRALVATRRPDVVYSALFVSNALAHRALAREGPPLVWGFRGEPEHLRLARRAALSYCRRHADAPALALFNSWSARTRFLELGFAFRATAVVPNGIDAARFRRDAAAGAALRAAWGLPLAAFVVGNVGRLAPMKDHATFLRAAAALARDVPDARFVCVGAGPGAFARGLRDLARSLGVGERVVLAGRRDDLAAVYSACDVLCLSSDAGEGFPNVLGEALACETPVVATDVGDAARVVGDAGLVVPAKAPDELACAWRALLERGPAGRAELGARGRERIVREHSPERCARETLAALASVL